MDLQKLQEELRQKALQRAQAEKAASKPAAPAGKVKGPIIDFRYRPNTKSIIGGIAESPIFRAGLIANGVDIVTAANELGHASPTTTANIYAHQIAIARARAADVRAGVFSGKNASASKRKRPRPRCMPPDHPSA